MYLEHFGLHQAPFRITPDTELFYSGANRGEVLSALAYTTLSGEGIIKVIGEVGSGKTMLCRMLEKELGDAVAIVYIANPSLSPEHILQAIAMELGLPITESDSKLTAMKALQGFLLEEHQKGRRVVVFIEEAQGMPLETLEEIRLLSNLETTREKLLQIILFGQPELDDNLKKTSIRQLRERITHSIYLQPLKESDTAQYLSFRMQSCGYRGADVFGVAAVEAMHRYAQGLVRRIHLIADKCLLRLYIEGRQQVTRHDVKEAALECGFLSMSERQPGLWPFALASMLLISGLMAAVVWYWLEGPPVVEGYSIGINSAVTDVQSSPDATYSLVGHLERSRRWLVEADTQLYTVQLLSVSITQTAELEQLLAQLRRDFGDEAIQVYQTRQHNEHYFGVLWREFGTIDEALSSLQSLPEKWQQNKPFVRSLEAIKQEQLNDRVYTTS